MKVLNLLVSLSGFLFVPVLLGLVFGFMAGIIGGIWSGIITGYFLASGKGKYATLGVLTVIGSTILFAVPFLDPSQYGFAFYLIPVPWIFFVIIRRSLYHSEKSKADTEWGQPDASIIKQKNRCVFCKKHPVSKKYHLFQVHKMKIKNASDYFENCGCENCVTVSTPGI